MEDERYTWEDTGDGDIVRVNISPVKPDGTGPGPVWTTFKGKFMCANPEPSDPDVEWEDVYQIPDGMAVVQKHKPDKKGIWAYEVAVYYVR